jgi:hypothetical protein
MGILYFLLLEVNWSRKINIRTNVPFTGVTPFSFLITHITNLTDCHVLENRSTGTERHKKITVTNIRLEYKWCECW